MSLIDIINEAKNNANLIQSKSSLMSRTGAPAQELTPKEQLEVDVYRQQFEILQRLKNCTRPQDVFAESSVDAAKVLVVEMHTAKTSKERTAAARDVIAWEIGKPLARSANLNLTSTTDLTETELNSEIQTLLSTMGFTDKKVSKRLILEDGEGEDVMKILEGEIVESRTNKGPQGTGAKASSDSERDEGRAETEELCSESGLPREFL